MSLAVFSLAVIFSALPWFISRRFASQFKGRERVVMQWSFGGRPVSFASTRVALTLTPSVGTLSLLLIGGFVTFATPQEERLLAMAMIPLTGLIIAGVHAVHLHFAARAGEY
jgi:hypothetical protein